jgi:hypothetical protein
MGLVCSCLSCFTVHLSIVSTTADQQPGALPRMQCGVNYHLTEFTNGGASSRKCVGMRLLSVDFFDQVTGLHLLENCGMLRFYDKVLAEQYLSMLVAASRGTGTVAE